MKVLRKYLKKKIVIFAGTFITDEPHLQPKTKIEKACDIYLRSLPDDYFEERWVENV